MKIRAVRSDDLDAIKALLAENELPVADITEDLLSGFAVAEDADGSVVGSVGLERLGANALLRSLAVAQTARNAGLGGRLLAHSENLARASGISELWLLTTTATDFFLRCGYGVVNRSSASAELLASTQFAQLCPASAGCMKKTL
ncbi:arsenic resistance N-acetyltransferase ArsN2 [Paraburkholderia bryophila]|uniref:Amino-acid N-acetyltransferase n=1 Tax=Paraburkholderia bryophila TaxID=420952 RepID=A0A7Y9WFA1_9BURK|nr:arsenic resistance N-acetyltransferase ArsN2 [Paraburkholderia bryophila]NYH18818.1 amino-acid N-acetyltransferase [Paraburkholderia bryophila]